MTSTDRPSARSRHAAAATTPDVGARGVDINVRTCSSSEPAWSGRGRLRDHRPGALPRARTAGGGAAIRSFRRSPRPAGQLPAGAAARDQRAGRAAEFRRRSETLERLRLGGPAPAAWRASRSPKPRSCWSSAACRRAGARRCARRHARSRWAKRRAAGRSAARPAPRRQRRHAGDAQRRRRGHSGTVSTTDAAPHSSGGMKDRDIFSNTGGVVAAWHCSRRGAGACAAAPGSEEPPPRPAPSPGCSRMSASTSS